MGLPDERELVATLTAELEPDANRAGLASDCAIVPLGDTELVASVDAFARATHFPGGLSPQRAGRLAAGAALSDLAAAGAEVVGVLAAYGVPDVDRDRIEGLARGVHDRVEAAGGEVLGGDTKPREELTATITALGKAPTGEAMTRARAEPGQRLVLTGSLGGAGAALDRTREGMHPDEADPLIAPNRIDAGQALRARGVRCCMDLSDGLADAAVAIGEAADVAVHLEADAIPLHPRAQEDPAGLDHALTTGGDYELVAAVHPDDLDAVLAALEATGCRPTPVGHVEDGEGAWLDDGDEPVRLERGYEHRFEAE
jgi:thiamine-monophosphate kinase